MSTCKEVTAPVGLGTHILYFLFGTACVLVMVGLVVIEDVATYRHMHRRRPNLQQEEREDIPTT